MLNNELIIYTDGAARGNPGRGGYGVVMMFGEKKKELSAGYRLTTNNRMELMAVIVALQNLKRKNLSLTIYTDSQYIVNAVTKNWLEKWVKTNFAGGKKNKDLWLQFYELSRDYHITFIWVKGHAANVYNNRCDQLATTAADGTDLLIDEEYEGTSDRMRGTGERQ